MSDTTAVRDEVAIAALDQRYASLRLVSPEELVRALLKRIDRLRHEIRNLRSSKP